MNECLLKVEVDSSWRCARLFPPNEFRSEAARNELRLEERQRVSRDLEATAWDLNAGLSEPICFGAHFDWEDVQGVLPNAFAAVPFGVGKSWSGVDTE